MTRTVGLSSFLARIFFPLCVALLGPFAVQLSASMQAQLSPSVTSPQPLGTPITWQATATGVGIFANLSYRFAVAPWGSALNIVRDYEPSNSFEWTPSQ